MGEALALATGITFTISGLGLCVVILRDSLYNSWAKPTYPGFPEGWGELFLALGIILVIIFVVLVVLQMLITKNHPDEEKE